MEALSDLAVFVQVVERGSFTAAAEHLELSKAVVSKYVGRLEKRLGARLLNRTTRRLTLTEAGEALYARASVALADLAAAEAAVTELTGTPRGRLRVTAPVHFGEVWLAPQLREFCARYPELSLELDLDNRLVDLVAEGFDVGLRIATDLSSTSMVARTLARTRLLTVASPAYLAARGVPREPADLQHHDCLGYSLDRTPSEWRYRVNGQRVSVRVHGRIRCNNDGALKRAVLDGLGILRFPALFLRHELASGALVLLLEPYEPDPAVVAAIFPTRRNLAPKVRVFVDFLAERLQLA